MSHKALKVPWPHEPMSHFSPPRPSNPILHHEGKEYRSVAQGISSGTRHNETWRRDDGFTEEKQHRLLTRKSRPQPWSLGFGMVSPLPLTC